MLIRRVVACFVGILMLPLTAANAQRECTAHPEPTRSEHEHGRQHQHHNSEDASVPTCTMHVACGAAPQLSCSGGVAADREVHDPPLALISNLPGSVERSPEPPPPKA